MGDEFYKSREILAEALKMQKVVEPNELILRAKVLSNLGQCYLATKEYDEANVHYKEAYDLFNATVGKRSPLFGMQAWACGNLRFAEGRFLQALPFFGEALYVEVVGDGLSVSEMAKLMDQILVCLHECNSQVAAVDASSLPDNTFPIKRALETLAEDPRWSDLEETLELGVLAHKMALVFVAARWTDYGSQKVAAEMSFRSLRVLRRLVGESVNTMEPLVNEQLARAQEARQWVR